MIKVLNCTHSHHVEPIQQWHRELIGMRSMLPLAHKRAIALLLEYIIHHSKVSHLHGIKTNMTFVSTKYSLYTCK